MVETVLKYLRKMIKKLRNQINMVLKDRVFPNLIKNNSNLNIKTPKIHQNNHKNLQFPQNNHLLSIILTKNLQIQVNISNQPQKKEIFLPKTNKKTIKII